MLLGWPVLLGQRSETIARDLAIALDMASRWDISPLTTCSAPVSNRGRSRHLCRATYYKQGIRGEVVGDLGRASAVSKSWKFAMEQLAQKADACRPSCAENQNLVTGHDMAILDLLKRDAILGVRCSMQEDRHININFKNQTITPSLGPSRLHPFPAVVGLIMRLLTVPDFRITYLTTFGREPPEAFLVPCRKLFGPVPEAFFGPAPELAPSPLEAMRQGQLHRCHADLRIDG